MPAATMPRETSTTWIETPGISIQLGAGVLDGLKPLLHLVRDEGGELLGRHVAALHAEIGEALLHRRIGERHFHRAMQALDDRARQAGGARDAKEVLGDELLLPELEHAR